MPPLAPPPPAERLGPIHRFGAFVTAIAVSRSGRTVGLALGDGTVRLIDPAHPAEAASVAAHEGAALSLTADLEPEALLSGGDDGRLLRLRPGAPATPVGEWPGRWIEQVACHEKPRLCAVAVGKEVLLLGRDGATLQTLPHDRTVAGLAFDPSGQRLAVAHYGGVTLWIAYRDGWKPTLLKWQGSHIAVTWSPNGRFIVSSMQENALHGWRLADKRDMRMSGYPAKVRSMSWAGRGRWLATGGAEGAVLWPFRGEDGPMGKEPLMRAPRNSLVVAVAAHPAQPLLAVGYKDGAVMLAATEEEQTLALREADGDAVSALRWTTDGRHLAIGTESGWATVAKLGR